MLHVEPLSLDCRQLRRLIAAYPQRYPVLFDSAADGALAGWTLLPIADGAALWLDGQGQLTHRGGPIPFGQGFLATLDAWWHQRGQIPFDPSIPGPWRPGWAVWLGYELAQEIEPTLRLPASPLDCGAFALRTPAGLVFDHRTKRCWGVAEPGQATLIGAAVRDAAACADSVREPLTSSSAQRCLEPGSLSEAPAQQFLESLRRTQQAIADGEVYQANISRLWSATLANGMSPAQLYERLRAANPAPFASWARFAGLEILSSSPERLLQIAGGEINTRPIAGTRPRHGSAESDRVETAALLAHSKERAEHIMLIDLERNDLGRICVPGSVEVNEFMVIESYAHVHHIVSNVRGRLRADVSPVAALRAVFPGGTITGCPKVRCMALIGELEAQGRGAYTGSLGWIGCDGSADFNILIRTLTLQGRQLGFRAGAGIVADSIAENELAETRAKARGLLRALGEIA